MELAQYGNVLRRWWWLLLLGALVAGGVAYQINGNTAPVYRAQTRLFVNQVQAPGLPSYGDVQTSERLASTYGELLHSRPVLDETIKQLNAPFTAENLEGKITASIIPNTLLLQVTVADTEPNRAATTANQLVKVFIKRVQELQVGNLQAARVQIDRDLDDTQQRIADTSNALSQVAASTNGASNIATNVGAERLQSQLTQDQDQYRKLLETRQGIILAQGQSASAISVADPALVPTAPVSSHAVQNIALGALLGLLLAAGAALLLDYFDDRIRDPEEIRERFNVIPVVSVPYVRGDARLGAADTDLRDSDLTGGLHLLRLSHTSVAMRNTQVICVTSALPGEGKSTIAANLAMIEAQAGKSVVLVDSNLRDPNIHQRFGLSNHDGLSTLLAQEDSDWEAALQEGPCGIEILPGGPIPPNPAELLDSPQMTTLMRALRGHADLIVLDTAPILSVTDTLILQRYVDGNIMVKDVRQIGRKSFGQALAAIERASGSVVGVVANKVKRRTVYGYGLRPVASSERKTG